MNGEQAVAEFVAGVTWDDLPAGVRRTARLALMDTLGATLAGIPARVSRITAEFAHRVWPGEESTVLTTGRKASAVGAAFANGYAANAVDIDDCAIYTKGHPGVQIFPTALALAEARGASGAEMLTAMVVGYEVAHRAARIWHATHEVYQACGSWGSVACAAVAAHLMGLPPERVQHALGIAEYHAPNLPMMRDIDHPAMVKHGIGWGAMTGILSAQLAAEGFTGIPSLFGFPEVQEWVTDIGERYIMVDGLAWKRYACCAWTHPALEGLRRLVEEHGFGPEDVERIRVEAFHEAVRLGTRLPTTTEEAQFNLAWPLAVFLFDGEVGPKQVLEPRLTDERVRSLARRVEAVETEEMNELERLALEGDPRGRFASRVVVRLRDGRELDSGIVEGDINYPQRCWDEESLERKFRWLVGQVLKPERVEALAGMIRRFEDVPNAAALALTVVQRPR